MNRENTKKYKYLIVGGGVSALALSVLLASKEGGESVAVLERLDRVGKKLLSTGNGQCNVLPLSNETSNYHGENPSFFNQILKKYGNSEITAFLKSLGVILTLDGDKYYPYSKQASSVLDAFRFKIESLGVNVFTGEKVTQITKENNFKIVTESKSEYCSQNVIIATGGSAQKSFGTDGNGYNLLKSFGHTVTPIYPSIVQLKTNLKQVKGLKGLKQKVNAKAVVNGKELASFYGDVMFTDYGVSGNATFYLSSYLYAGGDMVIDFCPDISQLELTNILKEKQISCPYLTAEYLLSGIINNKIACAVLRNGGFNLSGSISSLNAEKVALAIKNYVLSVNGTMGFENAQVTKGGVKTSEFGLDMQSKLVSGLYATGEVLDVDGDCGGFNVKWALASALALYGGIYD
ncbi:MAG: aminoacetone oxidase family FAD-binding enzyme [Clostridia bacterium]|nr:aminoacetone oxidase family FAD-binding enzyme [Clostridia bacterium]